MTHHEPIRCPECGPVFICPHVYDLLQPGWRPGMKRQTHKGINRAMERHRRLFVRRWTEALERIEVSS